MNTTTPTTQAFFSRGLDVDYGSHFRAHWGKYPPPWGRNLVMFGRLSTGCHALMLEVAIR